MPASTLPRSSAAIAVAALPIDTTPTERGIDAVLLEQVRQKHLRRRAGGGDAGKVPFQILDLCQLASALRRGREHEPGKSKHGDKRDELASVGRHLNRVVVKSQRPRRRFLRQAPRAPSNLRQNPECRPRALPPCRTRARAPASSANRATGSGRRQRCAAPLPVPPLAGAFDSHAVNDTTAKAMKRPRFTPVSTAAAIVPAA